MPKRLAAKLPHDFVEGDHVAVDQEKWAESCAREKYTDPARDAAIGSDTYRIVQAFATNPFVAVVSDTTGKRMGLSVRVLVKI